MGDIMTPFSEQHVSINGLYYVEIISRFQQNNQFYSINRLFFDKENFDLVRTMVDIKNNEKQ